ncbi:unnamed protein product [Bubo scandiacus]
MAPSIQPQAQREEPGHRYGASRTLVCHRDVTAHTQPVSLPDVTAHVGGGSGFAQYKATSLEKQHKRDLLTEPDLGVTIDLINPDTYRIDPTVLLDPADEKLLEEEIRAPTSSKRGNCRTETPFQGESEMWINPCAQVIFDSDPAPKDTSGPAALEMMSQAMIRGRHTTQASESGRGESRGGMGVRQGQGIWEGRGGCRGESGGWSQGCQTPSPFLRVRLRKRRARAGVQSGTNAVLVVKHRDMNEKELEAQEVQRAQLENDEPEEEEEEEMEAEKEAAGLFTVISHSHNKVIHAKMYLK